MLTRAIVLALRWKICDISTRAAILFCENFHVLVKTGRQRPTDGRLRPSRLTHTVTLTRIRSSMPVPARSDRLRWISGGPRDGTLSIAAVRAPAVQLHPYGLLRRLLPHVRALPHVLLKPLELRVGLEQAMTQLAPLMSLAR